MMEHEDIELVAGKDIPGDRFFSWKDGSKDQLTLIDLAMDAGHRQLDRGQPPPAGAGVEERAHRAGLDARQLPGEPRRVDDEGGGDGAGGRGFLRRSGRH